MDFNKILPELTVFDLEKTLNFYVDILGFKIEYEREGDRFAFLSFQGSQLMVQEFSTTGKKWVTGKLEKPLGRGIIFQIEVEDAEKLAEKLKSNNWPLREEITENWYRKGNELLGLKSFLVLDPDGHLLMFAEDIGIKKIKLMK